MNRRKRTDFAAATMAANQWNRAWPIATPVMFWTGARIGEGRLGETQSTATVTDGGAAVVWVTGHRGYIALTHVQPLEERMVEMKRGHHAANPV